MVVKHLKKIDKETRVWNTYTQHVIPLAGQALAPRSGPVLNSIGDRGRVLLKGKLRGDPETFVV